MWNQAGEPVSFDQSTNANPQSIAKYFIWYKIVVSMLCAFQYQSQTIGISKEMQSIKWYKNTHTFNMPINIFSCVNTENNWYTIYVG